MAAFMKRESAGPKGTFRRSLKLMRAFWSRCLNTNLKSRPPLWAMSGVCLLAILALGSQGLFAQPLKAPGFGKSILVRIEPKGVFPPELSISAGTTVIWLNGTQGHVNVVFSQGSDVAVQCQAPTRFFLAPDGTYTSNAYPPGAVASLACLQPGDYRYFISGALTGGGGTDTNLGTITVR